MRVPEGVSPEDALLMGDIFSTGFFCAEQAGVGPDGTYVVVGCGPVGLMTMTAAKELGVEDKDMPKVRRSFATKWQAFAGAGWWIQDVAGNWSKR